MPPRPPGRAKWFNSLFNFTKEPGPPRETVRLIGEDHLGHKYYEVEKVGKPRNRRYFERAMQHNLKVDPVDLAHVPPAWHAWLRHTRQHPPTFEEIAEEEDYYNYQQSMAKSKSEAKKEDNQSEVKDKPFPRLPYER